MCARRLSRVSAQVISNMSNLALVAFSFRWFYSTATLDSRYRGKDGWEKHHQNGNAALCVNLYQFGRCGIHPDPNPLPSVISQG